MRKWLVLLLTITFLLAPLPARAQGALRLSTLEVDLWPEFDRAAMLVLYKATFPPAALPADVTLRIPAAAGKPHVVATGPTLQDVSDSGVVYSTETQGEWLLVKVTMTESALQLEYYDPSLDLSSAARSFRYQWPGDYAVDRLTIVVQQPVGASDMILTPPATGSGEGDFGLTNYAIEAGALTAGKTFDVVVNYQKSTDALSVMNLPVEASAPIPDNTASSFLPWILVGGLGLALVIGGVVWYWKSGRQPASASPRKRHRAAAPPPTEGTGVYCHQCGRRSSPGDRFCRSCGATLRSE